jgi:hypothetical protein
LVVRVEFIGRNNLSHLDGASWKMADFGRLYRSWLLHRSPDDQRWFNPLPLKVRIVGSVGEIRGIGFVSVKLPATPRSRTPAAWMLSQPTPTVREYLVLHVVSIPNDASVLLLPCCAIETAALERVELVFSIQIREGEI